jgi:hypothetical protein
MHMRIEVSSTSLSGLLGIRSPSVANICDITAKLQGRTTLLYEFLVSTPFSLISMTSGGSRKKLLMLEP